MTPLQDDILRLMRFCPWTAYELADELRISEQSVRAAMNALIDKGKARIGGRSRHGRRPVLSYEMAA